MPAFELVMVGLPKNARYLDLRTKDYIFLSNLGLPHDERLTRRKSRKEERVAILINFGSKTQKVSFQLQFSRFLRKGRFNGWSYFKGACVQGPFCYPAE
jgi:hypothetical protein